MGLSGICESNALSEVALNSKEADDLAMRAGDIVIIDEEGMWHTFPRGMLIIQSTSNGTEAESYQGARHTLVTGPGSFRVISSKRCALGMYPDRQTHVHSISNSQPSYFSPQQASGHATTSLSQMSPNAMVPYQPSGPPAPYEYDQKQNQGQMFYQPPPQHIMSPPPPGMMVMEQQKPPSRFGKIGHQVGLISRLSLC